MPEMGRQLILFVMTNLLHSAKIVLEDLMWICFGPINILETWELHKLKQVSEDYEAFLQARRKLAETGEEQEFTLKSGVIAKVGWF